LLTQSNVNTLSQGDANPGKEYHYFELVLSLTTHNKNPYLFCIPFPNPSAPSHYKKIRFFWRPKALTNHAKLSQTLYLLAATGRQENARR
jgi:hypothetical protein